MNRQYMAVSLVTVVAFSSLMPVTAEASSNYSMRKKVITAAGILTSADDSLQVTRGEFAKMLVNASTSRGAVSEVSNVSVFADVDMNHEYASYIRTAAEQGWMTGFLGGKFKPEEKITMQEAVKAALALLGYTNEDFGGNQAANRLAKAAYLELDEEIGKTGAEVLNRFDCVNLFYNLLKTNMKASEGKTKTSSTVYASVLNYPLTEDGEINPLEALESKLKGPIAIKERSLSSILPFSLSKASFYLDGESASSDEVEDSAIIIYYNAATKAVYGYSEAGSGGRGASEGALDAIYYKSSDVMIPTSIVVSGTEYQLTTSDMQFAFSVYGDLKIGDEIIVVWESGEAVENSDGESDDTYTLIDYIE